MFRLVIEDDEGRATVVPLIRDELSIGRKEGNTIRLTERNVSRRHARVFRENNLFFVEDLGSYNGVRINGERIAGRHAVREGDLIKIGDYHLTLHRDAPKTEETVRPEPLGGRGPVRANAKTDPIGVSEDTPAPETVARRERPPPDLRLVPAVEPARLIVLTPAVGVSEIPLDGPSRTIGREGEVSIPHRTLEREHARVLVDGAKVRVQDLGGGVRVNGEACSVVELHEGDLVELGGLKLRFAAPRVAARPRRDEASILTPPPEPPSAAAAPAAPRAAPIEDEGDTLQNAPLEAPSRRRTLMIGGIAAGGLVLVLVLYFALRSPAPPPEPRAVAPPAPLPVPGPPAPPPPPVAVIPPLAPQPTPPAPTPLAPPDITPAPPPAMEAAPGASTLRAPSVEPPRDRLPSVDPEGREAPPTPKRVARTRPQRPPGDALPAPPSRATDDSPPEPKAKRPRREEPREEDPAPEPRRATAPEPTPAPEPKTPPEPKPDKKEAARARAMELFQKGTKVLLSSPTQAVGIFRQALLLDPSLADLHKNLGIAYSAVENNEAASRHFRMYLRMRPNASDAAEVERLLEEAQQK